MANNIVTAQVSIVGIKPLLWHAFGPDTLPLEKKERTGVAGNDPEEWRKTALVTSDGQLYVTGSYIFATILNGGKNIKRGRGSIMPAISSTLQVQEERILIDRYLPSFPNGSVCNLSKVDPPPTNSEELVYIDVRGTVNPATRARNVRYRVATKTGWRCTFTLMWVCTTFHPKYPPD